MNDPNRRAFVRTSCTAALFALGWSLTGCDSPTEAHDDDPPVDDTGSGITVNGTTITLDLKGTQARVVAGAGGFLLIRSARTIVVNPSGGTIRAFTSVCTHQSCDVDRFRDGVLVCPCHGSEFNTDGSVEQGPADAPLEEYDVARSGDTVTITRP